MNGVDAREIHDPRADQSVDFGDLIESLRVAGADQFDPVRLHYLKVLEIRAKGHRNPVKRLLEARLAQALAFFKAQFEQAQGDCRDVVAQTVPHYPKAAGDLQRLLTDGDFKAVRRLIVTLKSTGNRVTLGDLTRSLVRPSPNKVDVHGGSAIGLRTELQTTQYFRETWSKLSVGKRVTHALDQAPQNAGPLNSHRLVLRSLATMREISPDYLSRFTSYVDTLLALDQRDKDMQCSTKNAVGSDSGKKTKRRRAQVQ